MLKIDGAKLLDCMARAGVSGYMELSDITDIEPRVFRESRAAKYTTSETLVKIAKALKCNVAEFTELPQTNLNRLVTCDRCREVTRYKDSKTGCYLLSCPYRPEDVPEDGFCEKGWN